MTYGVAATAGRLGCSRDAVRKAIRRGALHATMHEDEWGQQVYAVSDDEIERYARESRGRPGPKKRTKA